MPPTLAMSIALQPPTQAAQLCFTAAWATLGDFVHVRPAAVEMGAAAVGLCWPVASSWPSLESCGLDLRAYGRGVREALTAMGVALPPQLVSDAVEMAMTGQVPAEAPAQAAPKVPVAKPLKPAGPVAAPAPVVREPAPPPPDPHAPVAEREAHLLAMQEWKLRTGQITQDAFDDWLKAWPPAQVRTGEQHATAGA